MLSPWILSLALCFAPEDPADGLALGEICHPASLSELDSALLAAEATDGAWSALRRAIGAARVIGLGEATHGTAEFLVAKHVLIRQLVTEHSATALLLEISVGEGADLDAYVSGARDDLDVILGSLSTWMFKVEEFAALLRWVREYNLTATSPLRIHGLEAQYADRSIRHALDFLESLDPERAASLRASFGPERIATRESCAKEFTYLYAPIPDAVFQAHLTLFHELRRVLELQREAWSAEVGLDAFEQARQHVTALGQFLSLASLEDPGARSQLRDYVMFVNVQRVLRGLPSGERALVWAHNEHVWKREGNGGFDVLGRQLDRWLGAQYYALGFDFGEGSYRAPGERGWVHSVPPPASGSLSAEFAALAAPDLFIDLSAARGDAALRERFLKPCRVRAHAGGYVPMRDGVQLVEQSLSLGDRYDGLIFIGRTSPSTLR